MNGIHGSDIEKKKARSNSFIREASSVATVQRKPPLVPPQVPRKRLPWLDGKPPSIKQTTRPARKPSVPGSFISEGDTTPASERSNEPSHSPVPKINPKSFLSADPSIRPIGSTPILRQKSAQPQIERPASSSDPNNFSLIIPMSLPFTSRSTLGDNITVLQESSSSTPFSSPRFYLLCGS
ncbi:hypothetical protein V2W45_1329427 [Cenococcum geophilum]